MLKTKFFCLLSCALIAFALDPFHTSYCLGQVDGGQVDGGQEEGGGEPFNPNFGAPAGIEIDATGVLRMRLFQDPTGQLTRQRLAETQAHLDPVLVRPSNLRKISLNRLESALAKALADTGTIPADMRYLAGMTRLKNVFFFPNTNDIVIAGPAEGYFEDISGRVVGLSSGQSVLELEDLIVALRSFPPFGNPTPVISCSIDPTQEGLQRMQQFLARVVGNLRPTEANQLAVGLRQQLGLQTVTIGGVAPTTHFAQVLVEADYRMKLIGIGLENPPVEIKSYVARANPSQVAHNAMQRWYFVPHYNRIRVSDDGLAMELVGGGVELVDEDQIVTADGNRNVSSQVNRASRAFVNEFTKQFDKLAKRSPVFAQLRNLIDMSIVAAFVQNEDYYGKADWAMRFLGNESLFSVETHQAPTQVESAVNVVWKGSRLMTPIGGGVNIQPQLALNSDAILDDENGNLDKERRQVNIGEIDEQTWWWD